jgi:hypothetical protein
MNSVKIAVLDSKIKGMGLKQEDEYTDLSFREEDLSWFWVSTDDDDKKVEIVFGCRGDQFVTPYSKETEKMFEEILNKY